MLDDDKKGLPPAVINMMAIGVGFIHLSVRVREMYAKHLRRSLLRLISKQNTDRQPHPYSRDGRPNMRCCG